MKLKKPVTYIELMTTSRGVLKARPRIGDLGYDTGTDALNRALDKLEKLIGRPS